MCYFDDVKQISDRVIPRKRALAAWKGFDENHDARRYLYRSPVWTSVKWMPGKARQASKHGFYAQVRRPRQWSAAAGHGNVVLAVLVWGRVREYRGYTYVGYARRLVHGYRAEFCMIVKRKRGRRK